MIVLPRGFTPLSRLQKKDTDLFIFCCPREAKFILSKSLTKPVLGGNAENIFNLK